MSFMTNDGLIDSARLAAAIAERGIKPYRLPWYKRWWPYRLWKWFDRKLEEPPPEVDGKFYSEAEIREKKLQELSKEVREEEPKEETSGIPTDEEYEKELERLSDLGTY